MNLQVFNEPLHIYTITSSLNIVNINGTLFSRWSDIAWDTRRDQLLLGIVPLDDMGGQSAVLPEQ